MGRSFFSDMHVEGMLTLILIICTLNLLLLEHQETKDCLYLMIVHKLLGS